MTCTAASHQGAIKEPAASLLRTSETHLVATLHNFLCLQSEQQVDFRFAALSKASGHNYPHVSGGLYCKKEHG